MRVIAGKAKGVLLKAPKGLETRPTSDRVKEAIFSSISNRVLKANVLDLFAGSGALGVEALSRGARSAFFIDTSNRAVGSIKLNLERAGFIKQSQVYKTAAEGFLAKFKNKPFDLIFIDAPYRIGLSKLREIINLSFKALSQGGILVVEHSSKVVLEPDMRIAKTKKYRQTSITYFKREL